jgi:pimeloyl-ACP methyl ester carboxylesterase
MQVIFSHGHLSSPASRKIQVLAPLARQRALGVEAIDYQDLRDDPVGRIERLCDHIDRLDQPPLLVGSSLGGLVSMAAAERHEVAGLFLLAPALFMEDRLPGGVVRESYAPKARSISVIHGWSDDIIPWQSSLKFAAHNHASLHLIDADHRLDRALTDIAGLFERFLEHLLQHRKQ